MTGRRAVAQDSDVAAVRHAARRTAWQVAAVSTGLVLVIVGLAIAFIVYQSTPSELLERSTPGESKIYVNAHKVLAAVIVLGAVAIVLIALASWVIARRTVTPFGAALQVQRAFVADAGHELRTPLTVLDLRVQLLQRTLDRGEPHDATLQALRRDARSMIEVVTDLLLVAEEGVTTATQRGLHRTDVQEVTDAAVADLQVIAEARSVSLTADTSGAARIAMPEVSFRRSLVVLIDNAVAHTPAGGRVTVTTQADRRTVTVRVSDSGHGIRGIRPDQIFERFARADAAVAPTPGRRSFGIGLALVRDLTARHGGRVVVEQTSPAGTTMRLEIPRLPARPHGAGTGPSHQHPDEHYEDEQQHGADRPRTEVQPAAGA